MEIPLLKLATLQLHKGRNGDSPAHSQHRGPQGRRHLAKTPVGKNRDLQISIISHDLYLGGQFSVLCIATARPQSGSTGAARLPERRVSAGTRSCVCLLAAALLGIFGLVISSLSITLQSVKPDQQHLAFLLEVCMKGSVNAEVLSLQPRTSANLLLVFLKLCEQRECECWAGHPAHCLLQSHAAASQPFPCSLALSVPGGWRLQSSPGPRLHKEVTLCWRMRGIPLRG